MARRTRQVLGVGLILVGTCLVVETPRGITADDWGPEQHGVRTRLVPLQDQYVVGQPMRFRVDMTNVGDRFFGYERAWDLAEVISMRVKGSQSEVLSYTHAPRQVRRAGMSLNPGETVVLLDAVDVSSLFHVVTPGWYTVQFQGAGYGFRAIPPSSRIEIDVAPGQPRPFEVFMGRLFNVDWKACGLSKPSFPYEAGETVTPHGRASSVGHAAYWTVYLRDVQDGVFRGKQDMRLIVVWQL